MTCPVRQIRAILTVPHDVDPFAGELVEAELTRNAGTRHSGILSYAGGVTGIRLMALTDIDAVAAAQARAFFDDPLQVWALPDATTRLELLTTMFVCQHVAQYQRTENFLHQAGDVLWITAPHR